MTGGDSGIGRATAFHFAREGADVAISYLCEHEDAGETRCLCEAEGGRVLLLPGDPGNPETCRAHVAKVIEEWGWLDILVNDAGEQYPDKDIEDVTVEQLHRTFQTNIFAMF